MEKKIADLTINEFQIILNQAINNAFEEISEDILAFSSPGYLESIEEARKDFKNGKTTETFLSKRKKGQARMPLQKAL